MRDRPTTGVRRAARIEGGISRAYSGIYTHDDRRRSWGEKGLRGRFGSDCFFVFLTRSHGSSRESIVPRAHVGKPDGCTSEQGHTQDPAESGRSESHILQAEAKITEVMARRMYLSGALDEINEPTITAGTLPMMIDVVTEN